jgi:hypothetical protein
MTYIRGESEKFEAVKVYRKQEKWLDAGKRNSERRK